MHFVGLLSNCMMYTRDSAIAEGPRYCYEHVYSYKGVQPL